MMIWSSDHASRQRAQDRLRWGRTIRIRRRRRGDAGASVAWLCLCVLALLVVVGWLR
jgi:hypothetical protein